MQVFHDALTGVKFQVSHVHVGRESDIIGCIWYNNVIYNLNVGCQLNIPHPGIDLGRHMRTLHVSRRFLQKQLNESRCRALVDCIGVAPHLESRKVVEYASLGKSVVLRQFILYLKSCCQVHSAGCYVNPVMLGPVGWAIDAVVQGLAVVGLNPFDDSYDSSDEWQPLLPRRLINWRLPHLHDRIVYSFLCTTVYPFSVIGRIHPMLDSFESTTISGTNSVCTRLGISASELYENRQIELFCQALVQPLLTWRF